MSVLGILKPLNFGTNPLVVGKGEANDATWLNKRYGKSGRVGQNIRELMYLLNSTLLLNLAYRNSFEHSYNHNQIGIRFLDTWINVSFGEE